MFAGSSARWCRVDRCSELSRVQPSGAAAEAVGMFCVLALPQGSVTSPGPSEVMFAWGQPVGMGTGRIFSGSSRKARGVPQLFGEPSL